MAIRFPKVCLRCGSLDHCSEDCTRMPSQIGMSDNERAMMAAARRDHKAVIWAAVSFVFAIVVTGWLQ